MSIKLANQKKAKLIDQERTYLNTLNYRLFTNNHTPADADTESAFTECTDSGYLSLSDNTPHFSAATLNGSNQGELEGDPITWTFAHPAGDFTIYGWYATDPADSDKLVMSEKATTPFTCTTAGQIYVVNPLKVQDTM